MILRQADSQWSREVIGVDAHLGADGCVFFSLLACRNALLPGPPMSPFDLLGELRATPGAFVDGSGTKPGNLLAWAPCLDRLGLDSPGSVAHRPDATDAIHDFAGIPADSNSDLAGALAASLIGGVAVVRLSIDGSGLGRHSVPCLTRAGPMFAVEDSALGAMVILDENLEAPDVHWGALPHPYRAVGVREIRRRG